MLLKIRLQVFKKNNDPRVLEEVNWCIPRCGLDTVEEQLVTDTKIMLEMLRNMSRMKRYNLMLAEGTDDYSNND